MGFVEDGTVQILIPFFIRLEIARYGIWGVGTSIKLEYAATTMELTWCMIRARHTIASQFVHPLMIYHVPEINHIKLKLVH